VNASGDSARTALRSTVLPPLTPEFRRLTLPERLILLASVLLVWFLAWGHPLLPPDEGRYGSVSARMVDTGNWLVPEFGGRAHLTKPPLTYWLQAIGIQALGRTEMAVRWPSLLATSIALLALFAFARRTLGTRPAIVATAIAALTPYVVVVGRLGNTDALMACFWIVALAAGHRLMSEADAPRLDRVRTAIILWSAVGLGFLTKREVTLGPLLILGAWAILARRPRELLRLHPFVGLPMALAPFAIWTALILLRHPDAGQIWWDETIGRVTGEKDLRSEPWWFYIPIYLMGMYPATAMLVLPWLNISWREALRSFVQGDLRALLLIAIVFPFLGFSISTGKLATYLLPLAPPTAMLVAISLERWLRGDHDTPTASIRPPDVRRTLAICSLLIFLGQFGAALAIRHEVPELWALVLPLAIAPTGCIACWALWRQGLAARARGLAIAWFCLAVTWTLMLGIQTRFTPPMGASYLTAFLERHFDLRSPDIIAIGFVDPTIEFYNRKPTRYVSGLKAIDAMDDLRYPAILLLDAKIAEDELERSIKLARQDPESVANRLEPLGATWTRWFNRPVKVIAIRERPMEPPPPPRE
jgi:4-amino-4-deoxy-L-arabinose transferase-like glycosyltransferase